MVDKGVSLCFLGAIQSTVERRLRVTLRNSSRMRKAFIVEASRTEGTNVI